jgi:hypothetical protein
VTLDLPPGSLVVVGIVLVVLAATLRGRSSSAWADWVMLRVGRLSFTEIFGAFLIGFGIGDLLAPEARPHPGPGVVITRFGPGMFSPTRLPVMLGLVAAAIDVAFRVDLTDLVFGARSPNSASQFVGVEARVTEAIPAGGSGKIAVRNAAGQLVSVAATASTNVPAGAIVQITGTQERTFVVAAIEPDKPAAASGA